LDEREQRLGDVLGAVVVDSHALLALLSALRGPLLEPFRNLVLVIG
jgi:hypothetical protein